MSDVNTLPPGFGEADPDFMRTAFADSQKERTERGDVVFLKSGITHIRVLPPHKDAPAWFREYKEHNIHPGGKFTVFTCRKTEADGCPICKRGEVLYASEKPEDKALAKRYYPKRAYLYNVYCYTSPEAKDLTSGILILKAGVKVHKALMEYDNDAAGGWGDITKLTSGLEFRIERKGQGRQGTEYSVKPIPTRSNLLDQLAAKGLSIGVPYDLTTIYPPKSYEELEVAITSDEPQEDK